MLDKLVRIDISQSGRGVINHEDDGHDNGNQNTAVTRKPIMICRILSGLYQLISGINHIILGSLDRLGSDPQLRALIQQHIFRVECDGLYDSHNLLELLQFLLVLCQLLFVAFCEDLGLLVTLITNFSGSLFGVFRALLDLVSEAVETLLDQFWTEVLYENLDRLQGLGLDFTLLRTGRFVTSEFVEQSF